MRIGAIPENVVERILMRLGRLPQPLLETQIAFTLARTIMLGVKAGVFETLASQPLDAEEVSKRCKTHPGATTKLLNALAGAGYLRSDGRAYHLAPVARQWLLKSSPQSLHDKLLMQFLEWDFVAYFDDFVESGKPLNTHQSSLEEEWELYQRGMRSLASVSAAEVAQRTPVPEGARDLLDIGGSHGYYSVALCRRHSSLRSVILDLPEAVAQAEKILAEEGMGDRVVHRAGDALSDDLGNEAWDVVLISQLVHHFDDAANRELARRVARALRPGGVFVVQEMIRPRSPEDAGQIGALLDLYFAATSEAGTWSIEEIADWQRQAGLSPRKAVWLRTLPGSAQQVAGKPAS